MRRLLVRRSVFAISLAVLTACGLFASPGEYGGGAASADATADGAAPDDALVQPEAIVLPDGNVVPASAGTIAVVAGEREPTSADDNPAWSADAWSGVLDATGRVASWRIEKSATLVGPFDSAGRVDARWLMINESFGLGGTRGTALQSTAWGPGVVGDWRASRASMPGGIDEVRRTFLGPYLFTVGGTRTVAVDGGTNTFYIREVHASAIDSAANALGAFAPADSLNVARSRPGLGAGSGFLYVVGGRGAGGIIASIEVTKVDPTTGLPGAFTEVTAATAGGVEHKVFLPGVVVADGYLFIAGGRVTPANGVTEIVISAKIDPATGALGAFKDVTSLPSALRDFGFVAHKGKLYVIGGVTNVGRTDEVLSATIGADGTLSAWDKTNAKLPGARSDFAVIAY